MAGEVAKVLRRIEESLALLEAGGPDVPVHRRYHLHNALTALKDDHAADALHLDEFDRAELAREFPELEADRVPTVDELRSHYDGFTGGLL